MKKLLSLITAASILTSAGMSAGAADINFGGTGFSAFGITKLWEGDGAASAAAPMNTPTVKPTDAPTDSPTEKPTAVPTDAPTDALTETAPAGAAMSIRLGEYLEMGEYYGEPILWRCVDIDENGPLMLSDKIICIKAFDAAGKANTATGSHSRNSGRQSYGSNYWGDSNMRSWLNSAESAGNVTWLCGNPPAAERLWNGYNAYDKEAGFLANFTQSERNAMRAVTQKSLVAYPEYENGIYDGGTEGHNFSYYIDSVVQNYDTAYYENVTDKIFLPDVKQVNAVYNNRAVLGDDYYIGEPTAKCVTNSEYKDSLLKAGNKWYFWLRSPDSGEYSYVRCVSSAGDVYSTHAYNYYVGVRPAFYLNLTSSSIKSGSGTEASPYTVDGGSGGDSPSPSPSPKATAMPGELNIPADINDVTINYRGTAFGYFAVANSNGESARNKSVSYTIDGGAKRTGKTDAYGYLCVQVPNVTQSHDYDVSISGSGVKPCAGTLSVTVTPLEFSSTYEATLTKGADVGIGIGVGGSIGSLGAEAQAAEIGVSGSNKKGLSYSQERKDGKTKLTVTAKENSDAAVKAKAGLWAGASAGTAGAEISAGDIGGSAKYGNTTSVGFEDEDFSYSDRDDVTRLAKFMVSVMLENMDSNVATRWLLEKIGFDVDTREKGSVVAVAAGASIGSVKFKNGDTEIAGVTLGGIDGDAVWSQSTKTSKDGAISRKSSVAADAGVKLGDVNISKSEIDPGTALWDKTFINNKTEFSAESDKYGNLKSLGMTLTDEDSSNILWSTKSSSEERTITYSDDAAKAVAESYSELGDFANGNKGFFSLLQMRKAVNAMTDSDRKGEFSAAAAKSKGIDVDVSAGVQMLVKIGAEVGMSGTESYSYETENGIYDRNKMYTQARNDIDKAVEDEFFGIEDAFSAAKDYMSSVISQFWDTVSGWIDNAAGAVIDAGKAIVGKTRDTVTGWKVNITRIVEDISPFSVMAVDSEFTAFSASSVATTIGNPYIISVEDKEGNEVTDLSSSPLLLTLLYTDSEIAAANVTDMNDVAVYRWDENKCVYVRMGGAHDRASKSFSLEITKTGQYILAADNCPPAVTEFKASGSGSSPEITAIVSDMSGIADFLFTIDGAAVVDNGNFEDYYNHTTAEFAYRTSGLAAGMHTAVIYASDSAGNVLSDGVSLEFEVNSDAPVISNVTELPKTVSNEIRVSARVTGETVSAVYLNIEETGADGRTARQTYEMTKENGVYAATAGNITDGATLNVWVSAYSADGNGAQSEKQTAVCVSDNRSLTFSNIENDSVTVTAVNCDDIDDGTVILAAYGADGTLKNVIMKDFAQTVKFDNLNLTDRKVKAMLWDSLHRVKPLAGAAKFEAAQNLQE